MSKREILEGIPQAVLILPTDQKPVDIDQANLEKRRRQARREARNAESESAVSGEKILGFQEKEISLLPDLKALDPDLVNEALKHERKVRRRVQ